MYPYVGGYSAVVKRPIAAFPAPLCEACNVAMTLNIEHRNNGQAHRREYQCPLCNAAKMVRRTHTNVTGFRSVSVSSPVRLASFSSE